jgi:hypothetical protein
MGESGSSWWKGRKLQLSSVKKYCLKAEIRAETSLLYRVFRAQADWTFILPSEPPTKELGHLPRKMPPQAHQTSQYVVPRGGIFLGKWRSSFAGSSEGKMKVQSACALNIRY